MNHVAAPPSPADIGLIAALPIEIAPFLRRLSDVRKFAAKPHTITEGCCARKVIAVVVTGPGQTAAARGAALLLAGHAPRLLISAGFAGALAPNLQRNQVVVPTHVHNDSGATIALDARPATAAIAEAIPARLLTIDRLVRTASEKAELGQQTQTELVDMETFAVARLAAERAVPLLAIRVISDDAHTDLPPELLTLVGPTGSYRVGAALGAIMKRPAALATMLKLREHANAAAETLDRALITLLQSLP